MTVEVQREQIRRKNNDYFFQLLTTYGTTAKKTRHDKRTKLPTSSRHIRRKSFPTQQFERLLHSNVVLRSKFLTFRSFKLPSVQACVRNDFCTLIQNSFVQREGSRQNPVIFRILYRSLLPNIFTAHSHETHRVKLIKNLLMKEACKKRYWWKPITPRSLSKWVQFVLTHSKSTKN